MTMGLIVGNRSSFTDLLARSGWEEDAERVAGGGHGCGALTAQESKYGAVGTQEESWRCAELYEAEEKQEGQESDPEHSDFTAT